ncbi:MAG: PilN domain-containing protein [Thermosulfidibacteraceae bacterium]
MGTERRVVKLDLSKPWKETKKKRKFELKIGIEKERIRKYFSIFVGITIGLVITIAFNLYLSFKISMLEKDYREKQEEMLKRVGVLKLYSEVIRKIEDVNRKKKILDEFVKPLEKVEMINNDLKRLVEPGLWLQKVDIDIEKKEIFIEGKALNEESISEYLRRLSTLSWISSVHLKEVKSVNIRSGEIEVKDFSVMVGVK